MLRLANPFTMLYVRMAGGYDRARIARWIAVVLVSLALGLGTLGIYSLTARQIVLYYGAILGLIGIMALGQFKRWLLAIIIIDIPFQLDFYLYWDNSVGDLGSIAGLPISLSLICLVVLYILWFFELAVTRKPPRLRPRLRSGWILLPYMGVVLLSMIVARNATLSIFEITLLVQMFLLMIYIGGSTRTKDDVHFLVLMTLVALSAQSIVVILARFGVHLPLVSNVANITERPTGSFGSPNLAGAYFAFFTPLALGVLLAPVTRLYKAVAGVSAVLGLIALLFTLSRGAWGAFAIAIIIIVALTWRRGWLKAWVPLALIIGAVLFLTVFQGIILGRLLGDDGGAAYGRIALVDIAWKMIGDHPILGVGANNFATVMKDYIGPDLFMSWVYTVHNKYLLVASELGILGIGAFIFFLIATLRRGFIAWFREDRFPALVALSLSAAILGHMFHMQADIFNARASVQMLWFAAGLLSALAVLRARQAAEEGPPPVPAPVFAFSAPLALPSAPFNGRTHPFTASRSASMMRPAVRPFLDSSPDDLEGSAALFEAFVAPGDEGALLEGERPDVAQGAPLSPSVATVAHERTSTRRVLGNAASMLTTEIFNRASTFVLYALVGRFLGDRAFGQMSLALTLFYTFQVFAIAGLKTLVTREVAKDRSKTDKYLVNGSFAVIGTSLASMAFAAVFVRVLNYPVDTSQVILFVSLSMFPVALIAIVEAIFQAWERMHFIAMVNIPVNVLKIGAALALLSGGADVNSVIGVLFVAFMAVLVAEWVLLLWKVTRPRLRIDLGFMFRMLRQTTTFFGIDGVIAIVASLNLVLLSKLASEREVGLIGAATQFLTPLQVVYQNVVTSLFPMMSRQLEPGFRSLKRITEGLVEVLVMFGLPATLGIFILAGHALVFLYGQQSFADATLVLRIYSITVILRAVIHALGQVLIAGMRERDTLRIVLIGIVLNVILGVALISKFGMLGAAAAGLIVTFVDLILHYYFIRRLFGGPVRVLSALWRPGIAGVVMSAFLIWALPRASGQFLAVVAGGAAIYAAALAVVLFLSVGGPRAIRARYLRGMSEAAA